ncbi:adenosine receptor A2a-like [Stylophora pistillata]|uniref:adenosine receptor A2a-like n=1 Tax=Stylophora pistillata TaxID=50429 RepID=UPI000C046102|nr:adenosine receptor A2a-like [Stylophora pistillata]
MANSRDDRNHTTPHQDFFCNQGLSTAQRIIISALGVPMSITAFLGNILIIFVLFKISSLHPPSKLLLGCLACTDLGVGLVVHPLRSGFYLLSQKSKGCYHFYIVHNIACFVFAGVSLSTMTAISVDRLLALLLGLRYRQVVTVRRVRVLIATLFLFCTFASIAAFYSIPIAFRFVCALLLLCLLISSLCYTKIYRTLRLFQAQVQYKHERGGQRSGETILLNKARYQKTVSIALWVQMALLACYLPYFSVTAFITITGLNNQSITFVWCLTVSLLLSNSTINPFLYYWKMREMRQAVKDTIRQFCCLLFRTKRWSITS